MTMIKTHNDERIDMDGSCLQGYIDVSYDDLVAAFGEPMAGDGCKVDAEWSIDDGTHVASIYNYKTGINYQGSDGEPTEQIRDWHIGGFSSASVQLVRNALREVASD
jgi:hypothetical protein